MQGFDLLQLALILIGVAVIAAIGRICCYNPRGPSKFWGKCGCISLLFGTFLLLGAFSFFTSSTIHLFLPLFVFASSFLLVGIFSFYFERKLNQWRKEADPSDIIDPNIQCLCMLIFLIVLNFFAFFIAPEETVTFYPSIDVPRAILGVMFLSIGILALSLILIAGFVWSGERHVWLRRHLRESKSSRIIASVFLPILSSVLALVSAILTPSISLGWASIVIVSCLVWFMVILIKGILNVSSVDEEGL